MMPVDIVEFDKYLETSVDEVWRAWLASGKTVGPGTPAELADKQIGMVITKFGLRRAIDSSGRLREELAVIRASSVQFWEDTLAAWEYMLMVSLYTVLTGEAPELDPDLDLPVVPVEEIALLRITRRLP